MKKLMIAALLVAAATVRADKVTHTEYPNAVRAQASDSLVSKDADVADGWSPFAIGLVPGLEYPNFRRQVAPFRFNVFTGRHLDVYGLDIGCLGNLITHDFGGLQVATLFNVIGESSGGVQIAGVVNNCAGNMDGVQIGLVNVLEKGRGLQVGFVNYGNVFYGVQIGALNIIRSSTCPAMPILNVAF